MKAASMQAQPRCDVAHACCEIALCGELGALGPIQLRRVHHLPLHALIVSVSVEARLRYPDGRPGRVATFNKLAVGIRFSEAFRDENAVEYSLSQNQPVLESVRRSIDLRV